MNNYFNMYSTFRVTKGHKRSVIIDLTKHEIQFIPNDLYEILTKYKKKSIAYIKKQYNFKFNEIIDQYFNFLLKKNIIFFCSKNEIDFFDEIDLDFEYPSIISNSIIDINFDLDYNKFILELDELGCKSIQIRSFYSEYHLDFFSNILSLISDSNILDIELIINEINIEEDVIINFYNNNPKISKLFFYNSQRSSLSNKSFQNQIIFTNKIINNETHCGEINMKNFSVNYDMYFESKNYNSCLNKKISVDTNGNIKNCPSTNITYGQLKSSSLHEIINNTDFQLLWKIKKDEIIVCKECEFRYICLDCRAYTTDGLYSKPLKCKYNPYEGEWID